MTIDEAATAAGKGSAGDHAGDRFLDGLRCRVHGGLDGKAYRTAYMTTASPTWTAARWDVEQSVSRPLVRAVGRGMTP